MEDTATPLSLVRSVLLFSKQHSSRFLFYSFPSDQQELEEILSQGRAPSPSLDMPQQLPLSYPTFSRGTSSSQQPMYNSYPKPPSSQKNDLTASTNGDFQRFYGPVCTR